MIWLRLFIAVIALTISSDLSAWGQPQKQINRNKRGRTISSAPSASAAPQVSAPSASTQPQQMQVNSPEGFYDCNGIANGANQRDIEQKCCLPSQQTFAGHCKRCAGKKECEDVPQFGCFTAATKDINGTCCFDNQKDCGKCYYTRQGCESFPGRGCGQIAQGECSCDLSIKKVCDKCNYTMQGCESISGCGNIAQVPRPTVGCPTTRCRQVPSNNHGWPMKHSHSSGCPGDFPTTQPGGGPMNFGHGDTFYYVTLSANTTVAQPCYGRTDVKFCNDPGKSGWIYATNLAGELITNAEAGTAQWRICDNGVIKAGTTLSPPVMYCRPQ